MVVNFESAKGVNCVRFMQATTLSVQILTKAHAIFEDCVSECKRKMKNIETKNHP
jgi:hypothetical protein